MHLHENHPPYPDAPKVRCSKCNIDMIWSKVEAQDGGPQPKKSTWMLHCEECGHYELFPNGPVSIDLEISTNTDLYEIKKHREGGQN